MNIPYLSLKRITQMHVDEIQQAVSAIINKGWYLQGDAVREFESSFATYTNAKYCVSTGNGLDALTLMIRAYKEMGRLHDGDEIIVPANTFIATILAITENNLTPVLVEPRIDNFQIDDRLIEQLISPKTKAIMIVHLYGYNAYTEKIGEICKKHNLLLLQDCAQAHGLPLFSRRHCIDGCEAYSFYPGKNLGALADAGAVTTDDKELAEVVRALGNYGSHRKYVFSYKGRNSRMDEITAAILSVKLRYLDFDNRRRQKIADYYIDNISQKHISLPPRDGVHHIFPILSAERDRLQKYLKELGIQTVIHYPIPPHKQECYKEWNTLSLPITEKIHREELSLPLNQAMTDEEVTYIVEAINNFHI
jgi:dTDP-4-amino-4,6-dideoxygalactose transaminase